MAVLAGAALAIANARVDIGRDAAAGQTSIAGTLGADRSWWVATGLLAAALAIALGSLLTTEAIGGGSAPTIAGILLAVGAGVVGLGAALGRARDPARLERAWELQAVGVAAVGLGWVVAIAT